MTEKKPIENKNEKSDENHINAKILSPFKKPSSDFPSGQKSDILDKLRKKLEKTNEKLLSNTSQKVDKNLSTNKTPKFVRGSYNKYTKLIRKTAIERVIFEEDFKNVSKDLGIPIKNLRRWVCSTFLNKDGLFKRQSKV